jgi:hypothetical protein
MQDEAVVIDLETGRSERIVTAATPVAALFAGETLHILARDGRVLQSGATRVALSPDPVFMRAAEGRIYIYCRTPGILEEIEGARVTRRLSVPPFASDFEVSGTTAFLTYPRDGRVRTFDLVTMKSSGEIAVGAVPVDLTFAGGGTALTARLLAVADPSAKRVWIAESTQSMTKAVTRGFLRGLLGLGLMGNRASSFPTGVDRVETDGNRWLAYDSSSGSLYRFTRKESRLLATNVPPAGFALTPGGVAWWNGTSVAETPLE